MPAQPELFLTAQAVDVAGFGEVEFFHYSAINHPAGSPIESAEKYHTPNQYLCLFANFKHGFHSINSRTCVQYFTVSDSEKQAQCLTSHFVITKANDF